MASPALENGGFQSELHRLKVSASNQKVALVKLTDEMIAAIQKAQSSRDSFKISIQKEGGVITLGGNQQFSFSIQSMASTPSDVILQDKRSDRTGNYQMLGTIQQKFQIQATDKSLDETRHRTKMLLEQESQKTAKEVPKNQRDILAKKVANTMPGRFDRKFNSSNTHQTSKPAPFPLKNKPTTSSSISNYSSSSTLPVTHGRPNMSPNRKAELMKKPLRARIIHLTATGKYSSNKEIYEKLKRDGLSDNEDNFTVISKLINEVGEMDGDGHFSLRPSLIGEVDLHWTWFTTEDKAKVRRISQPSTSAGFAPTRKNGIDRAQRTAADTPQKDSESSPPLSGASQPPARTAYPSTVQGKKVSPQMARTIQQTLPSAPKPRTPPQPQQTNVNVLDTLLPNKRKAHVPMEQRSEKRQRQESESPPLLQVQQYHRREKDSESEKARDKDEQERQRLLAATGGSTGGSSVSSTSSGVSSRLSSPILSFPIHPSQDWNKEIPEIKFAHEVDKYYQAFDADYPSYMQCFDQLDMVSKEFRDLAERLEKARKAKGDDLEHVERSIHSRYARYEKDQEFLRTRQRHADLRAKLSLLKSRIAAWEGRENSLNASTLF
ncbi:unnamed protein product, partial [Mesorhabditis belari]|uniref:OCEL domain-containing protein n=1 Tax=Mesorhabditis belari TaxID=2138241 RepID=A0AAF3FI52_9BILA